MHNILSYIQIGLAILLIVVILLQNRGAGLSGVFGGGGGAMYQTKRGIEKTLLIITIILSILFLGISFAQIIL